MLDSESAIDGTAVRGIRVVKASPTTKSRSPVAQDRSLSRHPHSTRRSQSANLSPPPEARAGWALLLEAHIYCENLGRDLWDFAVDIQSLRRAGLSNSTLRWMVCKGWLRHAQEVVSGGAETRAFRDSGLLSFERTTCFVLTVGGVDEAKQMCQVLENSRNLELPLMMRGRPSPARSRTRSASLRPTWNSELQQLLVGELLIKEFKLPCKNQGTILMAFEEEGWPPRIDDPLPPVGELDPRTRLRYTIKSLNKKQKKRLIRFMGDGTGMGVRWEFLADAILPELV